MTAQTAALARLSGMRARLVGSIAYLLLVQVTLRIVAAHARRSSARLSGLRTARSARAFAARFDARRDFHRAAAFRSRAIRAGALTAAARLAGRALDAGAVKTVVARAQSKFRANGLVLAARLQLLGAARQRALAACRGRIRRGRSRRGRSRRKRSGRGRCRRGRSRRKRSGRGRCRRGSANTRVNLRHRPPRTV